LIETTHSVADMAQIHFGLKVVIHPHAETHVEYETKSRRCWNRLTRTELGFAWIQAIMLTGEAILSALCVVITNGFPIFISKPSIKTYKKRVETERIPFAIAVGRDMFCEPSQGAVHFLAFRDVLRQIDYTGWAIVEQDMYPAPFDKPLPIAKRTCAYLREIGIG
jgi:inosose dehydratase